MKSTLKAGFIQFNPLLGDKKGNLEKLDHLIRQGKDADLLVIPELANTGYHFESKYQAETLSEDKDNSNFIKFLHTQAKQNKQYLVAGFNEREGKKLYNSAALVGPEGLLGLYRKIHLFWNEFDIFEKGNLGLPVFDIGSARIGLLICFDWVFPEVWRILAMKGADVICHPSNLVLPYAQQVVPVHGLINRTFNITANRYGTEMEIKFSGKSIISGPSGETIVSGGPDGDAVEWVEIDPELARNKNLTPRNHIFTDRRPEEYSDLARVIKHYNTED